MGGPEPTQAEKLRRQQFEQLVQNAIAKQQARKKLTQRELAAFERWEREQDARRGTRWVAALPKKFWVEWSGRQHRTLTEQARLYGIPLYGKTISVPAIARWLHDFLAEHRQPLSELVKSAEAPEGEAKSLQGRKLLEQIKQLQKRNQLLQHTIAEREQELVNREVIHTQLVRGAQILRSAGDRLYKQHGKKAGDILARALDDFQHLLDELHGQPAQEPAEYPIDERDS